MNRYRKSTIGIAALLVMVAVPTSRAAASLCQVHSTVWAEELECGAGPRGMAWGGSDGSGNKTINAWLFNGTDIDEVIAIGRTASGAYITECSIIDGGPVDLFPSTDSTGCANAVKFTMQINYY